MQRFCFPSAKSISGTSSCPSLMVQSLLCHGLILIKTIPSKIIPQII